MADCRRKPPCGQPHPKCGAHRSSDGAICQKAPIKGGNVCNTHGDATKIAKEKAALRLADEKLRTEVTQWGGRLDISPAEALLDLVQTAAYEVAYWEWRVAVTLHDGVIATWGRGCIGRMGAVAGRVLDEHGVEPLLVGVCEFVEFADHEGVCVDAFA